VIYFAVVKSGKCNGRVVGGTRWKIYKS